MDPLDLVSKVIQKVTTGYGDKVKKEKSAPAILDATPKKFKGKTFRAGFAMADINPDNFGKKTLYIAGHGSGHVMTGQLSDVFASAVWLDCGDDKGIVWISADIVGLTKTEGDLVRAKIRANGVLPEDCEIIISATHSHSGIDTIGYWGKPYASIPTDGKDPEYMQKLFYTMVGVAEKAYLTKTPGKLFSGYYHIEDGLRSGRQFNYKRENVYRLRFVPANGDKETWIVNYGGHPNSLGGDNRMLSGEYVYFLRKLVNEKSDANLLYGIGAIGGMDMPMFDDANRVHCITEQGNMLYDGLTKIDNERELTPEISIITQDFYLPVDNNVLTLLAIIHTMSFDPYPCENSLTGVAMKTTMYYMNIGDQKILTLPGENFINTVVGHYDDEEHSTTGKGPEINPEPLCEICDDENLIVFGVTNDMTGYVVPPNDFVLNPTQPFLNGVHDRFDKNHYHETNSMGINTQKIIADTFKKVVNNMK